MDELKKLQQEIEKGDKAIIVFTPQNLDKSF